jgi:hypothetical protein
MPTRLIRDGWLESERINQLKPEEERFFLRLCLRADDFGRYHANHALLKSNLFPLREDVRATDIPRLIAACEKAGVIRCYEHDGKRYVVVPRFGQRTRADSSKFPDPPADDGGHSLTNVGEPPSNDSNPPPKAESEADTNSKAKAEAIAPAAPVGQVTILPPVLCSDQFAEAWREWLQHRREKKEPVKPGSQTERQQLRVLSEWGVARAITAIRFTIFKGWTGIREPDERDVAKQNGGAVPWQRDSHNSDHTKPF